jgi:spoIIIJ-associated protein
MSETPLEVETTGETVGEAKWQALRELERLHPGIDKADVRFQVLSEGERGLLGVGYSPARVIATITDGAVEPAAAVSGSEEALAAHELVVRVTATLGVRCRIELDEGDDAITVSCSGPDLGILIGRHGQTIDALQYLANAIAYRRREQRKTVVVDAAGYRARRQATLESLAMRSAERALSTGESVELEPMTPTERKIVHVRLQDVGGVETTSEGAEPNRFVVVSPASGG